MESGSTSPCRICDLQSLAVGMPGVTSALGGVFAEAAAVCLEHQNHHSGVRLLTDGSFSSQFLVSWSQVTKQQIQAHNDLQDATEFGACGLAIILVRDQTGHVVVERSRKGTGFDFWLGDEDDLLFEGKARLEVSGILAGGEPEISSRVAMKVKQISRSDGVLPGYIAIVEFSGPRARVLVK